MKNKMAKSGVIVTPRFRVSFPNVFQPAYNTMSKKHEYNVQALFEKGTDLTKFKQAVLAVVVQQWGADKTKWPAKLKLPFRDQADRAKKDENDNFIEPRILPEGYVAGAWYVNLKANEQYKPKVLDENKQEILEPRHFYAGCYAIASVVAFAYNQAGNMGVSLSLQNLMKVADGDSLSGRTSAEADFASVETTTGSADDVMAGLT